MLAKSHIISTMIVLTPLSIYVEQDEVLIFLIAGVIGALFPDLDEKGSFLSRRVYFISKFISIFTEHRGWTHTLIIVLIYIIIGAIFLKYNETTQYANTLLAFVVGNIIHMIGDLSTRSGLQILYPFKKKQYYILPRGMRIVTNSKVEIYILIPFMATVLLMEIFLVYKEILQGII